MTSLLFERKLKIEEPARFRDDIVNEVSELYGTEQMLIFIAKFVCQDQAKLEQVCENYDENTLLRSCEKKIFEPFHGNIKGLHFCNLLISVLNILRFSLLEPKKRDIF